MSRSSKKHKRESSSETKISPEDTSKPSAVFTPTRGRKWTLSIAIPGSIIANAQTHDLKTSLAGQIARACAVFCVDEIVVFDDGQSVRRAPEDGGYTAFADPDFFLYHLLSYLETPPYMRKALFPMHPDLRTAGALPSLDMPHHLKAHEWCRFREATAGVQISDSSAAGVATVVHCGFEQEIRVAGEIPIGSRLTIELPSVSIPTSTHRMTAKAVLPTTPREEDGYYWGYTTRQASCLSAVFTECEFPDGYDFSIGTSERGVPIEALTDRNDRTFLPPNWKHLLVVIGGVAGLEAAFEADEELQSAGVSQIKDMFDRWINILPGQGSRTIRAEEALWITLSRLQPCVDARTAADA